MRIFKIFRKIMLIMTIVNMIAGVVGFIFLLGELDVIDIDGGASLFGSGNSGVRSEGIEGLLETAEMIDDYMADNGYFYDMWSGPWDIKYNDGNSKATCCATYVSWCLQEMGFISSHTNYAGDIYNMLKLNPDWKEIREPSDLSEMQAGDIGIYYNPSEDPPYTHTNIYAGEGQYWDAGSNDRVKTKGTITRSDLPEYILRYKK